MGKQVFVCLFFIASYVYGYNTLQVKLVKQKIKAKEYINTSRCDFRGADLSNLDFSGGQHGGAIFSTPKKKSKVGGIVSIPGQRTKLTNCNFSNSSLFSTSFEEAILTGSNFSGADIQFANFSGADLTGAKFDNIPQKISDTAIFCGATMPDGTKCTGTSWTDKTGKIKLLCHCPKKK